MSSSMQALVAGALLLGLALTVGCNSNGGGGDDRIEGDEGGELIRRKALVPRVSVDF